MKEKTKTALQGVKDAIKSAYYKAKDFVMGKEKVQGVDLGEPEDNFEGGDSI